MGRSEYNTFDSLHVNENMLISRRRVLGELASWAVQQSPYVVPDGLADAIEAFNAAWEGDPLADTFPTMRALEDRIFATFDKVPQIIAWGQRKNGRDGMGVCSRYDQPHPDDDFIDLHALARNVAMGVWADAVDFAAFNADFDRRWAERQTTEPKEPQSP
jgi:hypothetical protein